MFDFSSTYFDLFGMPLDFSVDTVQLQSRYREVQRQVHPDRFASATEQEKRMAMQYATRVNEAYRTLRSPLERARYLLALDGVQADTQASVTDAAFLMTQMELREALSEIRDAADPLGELDALTRSIDGLRKALLDELAGLFEQGAAANKEAALQAVQKLQFLDKLVAEAEAIEAELEDVA